MIFYKLNNFIEQIFNSGLSREQKTLQNFVGQTFSKKEAEFVWGKVLDHKWYVSEYLGRDVGLRVAANDYVENFYEPRNSRDELPDPPRAPFRVFSQYDYFGGSAPLESK
jgi:hypothetical protein